MTRPSVKFLLTVFLLLLIGVAGGLIITNARQVELNDLAYRELKENGLNVPQQPEKRGETGQETASATVEISGFPMAPDATSTQQIEAAEAGPEQGQPATTTGSEAGQVQAEPAEAVEPRPAQDVPFTPQAPIAEWEDARQQDGCEEASSLMADAWLKGYDLDAQKAKQEIIKISEFERDKYGVYQDTSARDTAERILKGYFGMDNWEVRENASLEEIRDAVLAGHLVIAPMNGQTLDNPYYTPPGPLRHMIVIIGYEQGSGEFVTNDPGTKRGEDYKYDEQKLFASIRDYPTGNQVPIQGEHKNVIIVKSRF